MTKHSISAFINRYTRLLLLFTFAGLIAFFTSANHSHAGGLRGSTASPLSLLAPAVTFTVNDISDGHDGNPGDGLCDTGVGSPTGACTFRAALEEYLALAGGAGSTINFNLSGLPAIISPTTVLPTLTKNVIITGPGADLLKVRGNATFTMFTINPLVTVSISGLSIEGGKATSAGTGGGFTNNGLLTLNSCNLQGNSATNGGGIVALGSSTTNINNSSIVGNQATANGGAIFHVTTSTINLNNSTVALNTAGFAAIANNGGTLNITSSTITSNISPGVFTAGSTSFYNTICASNTAADLSGNFTSNGHNLIGNGSGSTGFTNGVNGDMVGVNAKLAPLNSFGGPTFTSALIKSSSGNSPAIDAGNNTSAPATDQRGVTRPFNTTVDIGAFEARVDVSPATLPGGTQNEAYSTTLSGTNGTGPYTFTLASGAFPTGISMSAAGVISGTTSQTGTFPFVVIPRDVNGFGGARSYNLVVGTTNPGPSISSLNPTSAQQNSSGGTVTITGSNFIPTSVVQYNGSNHATSFVNNSTLTITLSAADTAATGAQTITVFNPAPGGGTTSTLLLDIDPNGVCGSHSTSVSPGGFGHAIILPGACTPSGVDANLNRSAGAGSNAILYAASYSGNPTGVPIFNVGGGFLDVKVTTGISADSVNAIYYYPTTITGTNENGLKLFFFNVDHWQAVRGSGGADPIKNTNDNQNGTTSGGAFAVTFDNTSTPLVTQLTGTVFTFSTVATPTAANGSISGRITTNEGVPVAGVVINLSGPQSRKTITDADGKYELANVETNGFYTVTPARSNFNFSPFQRSFSQLGNQTEAGFSANSLGDNANPLDTPEYFVRQQYLDVLGREPDEAGFNYWSDRILACGTDESCTRAQRNAVAAAFFIEPEARETGAYIFAAYAGALGRRPVFAEYLLDRRRVIGGANLAAAKTVFAQNFVQRAEFTAKYQNALTAESFVDELIQSGQSTGVDISGERANLIGVYAHGNQVNSGDEVVTRRAAVISSLADNATFKQSQYNQAFVLIAYFAYLRRDVEPYGYDFWVNVLDNTGSDREGYPRMVCSFITAAEYQRRFSSVVTHGNSECR